MKKAPKQEVCCEVSTCVYNVDGCGCSREAIVIAKDDKNEKAHYCKSFERGCGFKDGK